ncbi:MAG: cytochrome c oxidase subunit II [Parvibaculum sp.]|uniref:cytochrome c oxidase subunit II n=1 Tax=Parvibaculum sp. TaxID=2024848 RepID=UPI0034A062C7
MRFLIGFSFFAIALAGGYFDGGIVAAALANQPHDGGLGFQSSAAPIMDDLVAFHTFLLWIITIIVVFVTLLLGIVAWRFNRKRNPNPSRTTHNTLLEVAWTVVPVMILVVIAIPSFRLLYKQIVLPEAEMTVKAVGYQWYWGYEYPDHGDISVISNMIPDDQLQPGQPRLLAADYDLVVPVDTTVRVIVTASDVIHAFAVPSFGVKIDAIPGRLNETWFRADRTGMFYGQCSELCGTRHAFMPISVKVVTKEEFGEWVAREQQAALGGDGKLKLAEAPAADAR